MTVRTIMQINNLSLIVLRK